MGTVLNVSIEHKWQVKDGTIFNNVVITNDKADASNFVHTWKALNEFEKRNKKKEDDDKKHI